MLMPLRPYQILIGGQFLKFYVCISQNQNWFSILKKNLDLLYHKMSVEKPCLLIQFMVCKPMISERQFSFRYREFDL